MKRMFGLMACLAISAGANAVPISFTHTDGDSGHSDGPQHATFYGWGARNEIGDFGRLIELTITPYLGASGLDFVFKDKGKRTVGPFDRLQPKSVPEPTTIALMGLGLLGIGLLRRRGSHTQA